MKIETRFLWRFYPGVCLGIRTDDDVEQYYKTENDDCAFELMFRKTTIMVPFFEMALETSRCINGVEEYLKSQEDEK